VRRKKVTLKNINSRNSGNHPLYLIDARVKLMVALCLLIMVVSSKSVLFPLLTAGVCLIVCLSLKIRLRILLTRFAEPLFIAAVVLILKAIGSGSTPLFALHLPLFDIVCYHEGLIEGFRLASRIIGGVAVVAAVGFATGFTELLAALSWFKIPREVTEIAMFVCSSLPMMPR
jgi:cobalt/nickel transport system permease protein